MFNGNVSQAATSIPRSANPVPHPYIPDSVLNPRGILPAAGLDDSPFMRRAYLRRLWIHGVVTEVRTVQLYRDKTHKILDLFLGDEPKDFAHTTFEYALRIRALPDPNGTPSPDCADVRLYGNYLGGFTVGDELKIKAKKYILLRKISAKRIYNLTTKSYVTPELQIPAGLAKLPVNLAIAGVLLLVIWGLASSGGAAALLSMIGALLALAIPPAAILFIIWKLTKGGH